MGGNSETLVSAAGLARDPVRIPNLRAEGRGCEGCLKLEYGA